MGSGALGERDAWLELKYFMSGCKLLAEMAYMGPGNRERILKMWFTGEKADLLREEMLRIVEGSFGA